MQERAADGQQRLDDPDIEALERATLAAVTPGEVGQMGDWLLPFDSGTIGRAKSAVPVSHRPVDASVMESIEALYRARGLQPIFRLPDLPAFAALQERLAASGYERGPAVNVQVIDAAALAASVPAQLHARVDQRPDAAWAELFLGPGFDPVDGANRVRNLSRAEGTVFASLVEEGATIAGGAGGMACGWASIHGMRTAQAFRGRNLAGRVLAGLAAHALSQGLTRIFLQVEEGNASALALYRRVGFSTAWRYRYWKASSG
ncbi:MAG: GNAT family N-acetyltransferase [Pseudomonadota bacterium]